MGLSVNIHCKIKADEIIAGALQSTVSSFNDRDPIQWAEGSGLNQAQKKWSATRTILASGTDDLDLNALTDADGRTINFTKIKAIHIRAAAGNTNDTIIGNAAATQFLAGFAAAVHRFNIPPGGAFMVTNPTAAGWASTNGATDILRITNGGGSTSVTYDIELVGV